MQGGSMAGHLLAGSLRVGVTRGHPLQRGQGQPPLWLPGVAAQSVFQRGAGGIEFMAALLNGGLQYGQAHWRIGLVPPGSQRGLRTTQVARVCRLPCQCNLLLGGSCGAVCVQRNTPHARG